MNLDRPLAHWFIQSPQRVGSEKRKPTMQILKGIDVPGPLKSAAAAPGPLTPNSAGLFFRRTLGRQKRARHLHVPFCCKAAFCSSDVQTDEA